MMMMLRDFFPIFKLFSFSNLFSITPKRQKPARLQKIHRQSVKHRTTATERKKSSAMETHKNSYLMLFYDLMWICVFEFIMITGMGFVYLRQSATCTFSANAFIESPERKKTRLLHFWWFFPEKKLEFSRRRSAVLMVQRKKAAHSQIMMVISRHPHVQFFKRNHIFHAFMAFKFFTTQSRRWLYGEA